MSHLEIGVILTVFGKAAPATLPVVRTSRGPISIRRILLRWGRGEN